MYLYTCVICMYAYNYICVKIGKRPHWCISCISQKGYVGPNLGHLVSMLGLVCHRVRGDGCLSKGKRPFGVYHVLQKGYVGPNLCHLGSMLHTHIN